MSLDLILIVVTLAFGFLALYLLLARAQADKTKAIVNQVFGEITNKVGEQTKNILASDRGAIEELVHNLQVELKERQKDLRSLEGERDKQFGDIKRAIMDHQKITEELKTTTDALKSVLSNNQTRGAWGERIIEDLLHSSGLVEGVHYARQQKLGSTDVRPDITLLLPNGRKVAIDVKFPYAAIQEAALTTSQSEKDTLIKRFSQDLKAKLKQVEERGYINVDAGTLDYAIIFVPNETLFSFINQQFPGIVDEAMNKKIMLVSPFTFLIVARTVMESYRNFMVENNLRKIVKYIADFVDEWGKFTIEFNKFDDTILKLRDSFDHLHTTRYKMMESKIKKIESYRQGSLSSKQEALKIEEG